MDIKFLRFKSSDNMWVTRFLLSLPFLLFCCGCATSVTTSAPTNQVKAPTVKSSPFLSEIDPNNPAYLKNSLAYYGLNPLTESPKEGIVERYRFLYCRWLAPAGLFEIEFQKDGTGTYRAMTWNSEATDDRDNIHTTLWSGKNKSSGHWTDVKIIQFTQKDLEWFRLLIERWKLYELPWYDQKMALDGSSWFIELESGAKYHSLFRDSPEAGPVKWFGTQIIELAIDSPFIPIQ